MSNCISKINCLVEAMHAFTVSLQVHASYRCPWLRMARPRPSAQPIQTASHQQAGRCVETWTASAWWSSSCPSSQFHHLGPTALRERHQTLPSTITDTISLPFLINASAHQQRVHTPSCTSTVQWNNCSGAPFAFFPCVSRGCVCVLWLLHKYIRIKAT